MGAPFILDYLLDGYGSRSAALGSEAVVQQTLSALPAEIGMTVIDPPRVFTYTGGVEPRDWGVTGTVVIAESHIAIHTFPEHGFIQARISSCKGFDRQHVREYLMDAFGLRGVIDHHVELGLENAKALGLVGVA